MKSIFQIALIGVVALALSVGGAAATNPAGEAMNETANQTAVAIEEQLGGEEINEQIDSSVTLVEWTETETGGISLTFDAEQPTRVTVTSQDELSEGVGRMAIQRQRVLPGGSTITLSDTEAVAITTEETIDAGYGVTVSTTNQGGGSLPSTSILNGVLIGIVTMLLGMGIAVNRKRSVDHKRVESGWKD